jgi:transcription antitermination factor NusG
MFTKTLDPEQISRAEKLAEQKWGSDWRSKRLDQYFGKMAEYPPAIALSRKSYLLAAAPQQEAKVEAALREAGFDVYLPREPKSIRVNHIVRRMSMRPMLPGYIFPIFDEHRDNWQIIKRPNKDGKDGIEGVLRLFLFGERPVPVPEDAVQQLRDRESREFARSKIQKTAGTYVAQPGDFVQIDDGGPWQGFIGQVIDLWERATTLLVELDIFGRKTPVEVNADAARAI